MWVAFARATKGSKKSSEKKVQKKSTEISFGSAYKVNNKVYVKKNRKYMQENFSLALKTPNSIIS